MKSYLSDVQYEIIPQMTVISGVAVGSEPEDHIINMMGRLKETYGLKVDRHFGFDIPVEGDHDPIQYRGYEFWLVIDPKEIQKLPGESFTYEGTPIQIKGVPGYRYATLTIDDPFVAAFERIPSGWEALVTWLEEHNEKMPSDAEGLEEVVGNTMRIYIPVDLA